MAEVSLPRPVARSSSRVAPPRDDQAQVPSGSELHLEASSTCGHESGYHSKTSVPRYPPLIRIHSFGNFAMCGQLLA